MKSIKFLFAILIISSSQYIFADVTVGIVPLKGTDQNIENVDGEIKEILSKSGGISIITDKLLKNILEIQEKAQSLGSAYHDISKLKTAEYLISGIIKSGKLTITVVDVNTGTEIFNKQADLLGRSRDYRLRSLCMDMRNAILVHASSKQRQIPEEAEAYMDVLNGFVSSLGSGNQASYKYLVFYYNGKYQHPKSGNKGMEEKAKTFIRVVKRNLIRSKLSYLFMKSDPPWVFMNVIAKKYGKKTKHKFGIIELDDGSLGIGIYKTMD